MKIRFIKPDPRAGLIAQFDSSRGQQLVDQGAAERVDEARTIAPATLSQQSSSVAPMTSVTKAAAPTPVMSKPVADTASKAPVTPATKPAAAK